LVLASSNVPHSVSLLQSCVGTFFNRFSRFVQLLDDERCLLVYRDHKGDLSIYLEPLTRLSSAIERASAKKKLRDQVLVAYDETKRMLTLCISAEVCQSLSCSSRSRFVTGGLSTGRPSATHFCF
jgi:hypothetical protein